MYRILPKHLILIGFGWVVLGLVEVFGLSNRILGTHLETISAPEYGWLLLTYVFLLNPVWRFIWKFIPALNRWFPDLNGTWDVELRSNWTRQEQMLEAADHKTAAIDMRLCPETSLAALKPMHLRAEISQSWWQIEISLTNPAGNSPMKESLTFAVEAFAKKGLRSAGIAYFFKQANATANVSDDNEFYGAARLSYQHQTNTLEGIFWSARMWQRAINTAGTIRFTRV
jgi:hypothetical protein